MEANEVVIPQYDVPEEDIDGNAIQPFNFLPTMADKLPEDWFIRTFPYFKYMDKSQRDKDGNVCAPIGLSTANPANVKKWRELAISVLAGRFTEEGKYHYGLEIAKMTMKDRHTVKVLKDGRQSETPELAMKIIFDEFAPDLPGRGHVGELIAIVWKWLYVPNPEGNNQWVKENLKTFFKLHGARVVLSGLRCKERRVHSVVAYFKKYGTQSAVRTFKNNQRKMFGFTIDVNKSKKSDDSYPPCANGETWSSHNIEGYLDKGVKILMQRTGGFVFLVRHHDQDWDHVKLFKSDLFNAMQKAINDGCNMVDVANELEAMRQSVALGYVLARGKGDDVVAKHGSQEVEPMRHGGWSEQGGKREGGGPVDDMYTADIDNLRDAGRNMQGEDRISAEGLIDALGDDWTMTSLGGTDNTAHDETLKKSPRKSAEENEKSPVAMGTSTERETTQDMGVKGKQDGEETSDSTSGTESGNMIQNKMREMEEKKKNKAARQGEKRKSDGYGSKDGQTLVGSYRRGLGKKFVIWHCKDAFTEGNICVDGVCNRCRINDENKEHSCKNRNQKLSDYKYEDNP